MFDLTPPRLVLIGDRFRAPDVAVRITEAVAAGVRWVQLRDHGATPDAFESAARALIDRLRALVPDVALSVNSRVEIARDLGVGLHCGAGLNRPWATPAGVSPWTGSSVHTPDEARSARGMGHRYVFYSPIFPTASKPGHPGVGLERLHAVCREVEPLDVYALGGVTPERVGPCLRAGARGVAVLSGILHAPDVARAVEAYQEALLKLENS